MIERVVALVLLAMVSANAAVLQISPGAYTSGKAYVTGIFDGAKEKCLLDTGSAMTLLADSKRFGEYTNVGTFRFVSASGVPQQTETIQIQSIRIDQVEFTNAKIGRAGFDHAENTLGIDLLGRQPFALRFKPKAMLQLNAPRPPLPLTTLNVSTHGVFTLPLAMNGIQFHGLWDTGAALTFVDQDFITAHSNDFKPTKKYMKGVDGAGHALLVQVFRAKRIVIADVAFEDVRVVAGDLSVLREMDKDIQAVIGFNLIRKANWFFDPKARLWKCYR